MIPTPRKLALNRQTIRSLDAADLAHVVGGAGAPRPHHAGAVDQLNFVVVTNNDPTCIETANCCPSGSSGTEGF